MDSSSPIALILAGGFATRLWPLTEKRAKPLLQLAGKPIIQHIIDDIPKNIPIIISTNQQFSDDFTILLSSLKRDNITLFIEDSQSDNQKKGALAATAQVISYYNISSPLLLITGDNYLGFSLSSFLEHYDGRTLLASFDTKSLIQAKQFGVLQVENNRLIDFIEKPSDPPSTLVSTGCYLFSPEHLNDIQKYSQTAADNLGGIFEYLLNQKQNIKVFTFSGAWRDIGSFKSYLDAHIDLSPPCKSSQNFKNSKLSNSQLSGAIEIGQHCSIENSSLENVIIHDNCHIINSVLRNCIIDEKSTISHVDLSSKMIRRNSNIKGEV